MYKRQLHANVRADTSGVARSVKEAVDGITLQVDSRQTIGALRRTPTRNTEEN